MSDNAYLIGNDQIIKLEGPRGTTPECPEAKFKRSAVVKVRRLKHLQHLPEFGAVVGIVPPGFSSDHAWDDLCGRPRRLMCQVPSRKIQYIIAFEDDPVPHVILESALLPTDQPTAEVKFSEDQAP